MLKLVSSIFQNGKKHESCLSIWPGMAHTYEYDDRKKTLLLRLVRRIIRYKNMYTNITLSGDKKSKKKKKKVSRDDMKKTHDGDGRELLRFLVVQHYYLN